jgi:hypothetical protein
MNRQKGPVRPSLFSAQLPPWNVADLPEPPPPTFRNRVRFAGPGAILLALSIGAGEWLLGPAIAVQYGPSLLGVVTLGIVGQLFFNLEGIRYTLCTGEPIYGGFLRLRPGPRFWTPFYIGLVFVQQAWPAMAASAAIPLVAIFYGGLPTARYAPFLHWVAVLLLLIALLLLCFGGTVERMLEILSKLMVGLVLSFLFVVNLFFVPWQVWGRTLWGFLQVPNIRGNIDWPLLGALAATAAAGGLPNLTITNWIRDKGYGMGSRTGAIPSAFGGSLGQVSPFGTVFNLTEANLLRWRAWTRFVHFDQIWIWAGGAFLGMYLNVNLAMGIIPPGTKMSGMAIGVYQAKYMAESLWVGFWALALLNGFWILFSTQLGNTDMVARTVTDLLWLGGERLRTTRGVKVQTIYYAMAGLYTSLGIVLIHFATPLTFLKIIANLGGLVMVIGGIQILLVNRKLLPPVLQPTWWRQLGLVGCVIFYAAFQLRIGATLLGG